MTTKTVENTLDKKGFGKDKIDSPRNLPPYIDFNNALTFEEVEAYEMNLEDLKEGEVLPLDYGICIEDEEGYRQLNTYKFKQEFLDVQKIEDAQEKIKKFRELSKWESDHLRRADKIAKGDINKHVTAKCKMLASCIESIGGYSLDEILKKIVGLNDKTKVENIFSIFPASDIGNIIYSLRWVYKKTWDYYVGNQQCPCGKKQINDCQKADVRSLGGIKYKRLLSDEGFSTYPVFKVKVTPFIDIKGSMIDTLYLRPILFYELGKIYDKDQSKEEDITKQLEMTVVGMPQSEVYGQNPPGRIFQAQLWKEFMLNDTREDLQKALIKLNPGNLLGLKTELQIDCPLCPQSPPVNVDLSWMAAYDFILGSVVPRPEN